MKFAKTLVPLIYQEVFPKEAHIPVMAFLPAQLLALKMPEQENMKSHTLILTVTPAPQVKPTQ